MGAKEEATPGIFESGRIGAAAVSDSKTAGIFGVLLVNQFAYR